MNARTIKPLHEGVMKKVVAEILCPSIRKDCHEAEINRMEEFSELGSGLNIAMRDLDIRGAGDMLGGEQSGFINDMGFETYQKILNEAVKELKSNEFKDLFDDKGTEKQQHIEDCVIETDLQLLIPDWYVNNITERLNLYKELDDLNTEEELSKFEEQLADRFGPVPEETSELLDTIRLRDLAKEVGFERLRIKTGKLLGYFMADQNAPYFQSDAYTRVLRYAASGKNVKLKEKNGKLYLIFEGVSSIKKALSALQDLVGVPVKSE